MKRIALALCLLAASLPAQNLQSLPRATGGELNDSTLMLVQIASPFRTRAATVGLLKAVMGGGGGVSYPLLGTNGTAAAPTFSFTNSTGLGLYRFGADSMGLAAAGANQFIVSASRLTSTGTMTLNVGNTGATSTSFLINTRTAAGTQTPALRINELQQVKVTPGTAANPGLTFTGDSILGMYRPAVDTIGFAVTGVLAARITAGTILGPSNGGLTVQAGTGNNRTLILAATNGTGVATNVLSLAGASAVTTAFGPINGPAGSAAIPVYSFTSSTGLGLYRFGADTLGIATGGSFSLRVSGGVSPVVVGNGSTVIRGGTATGNTLTLRSGSNQNTIVLQSDSVQFAGLIYPAGNNGANIGGIANSFNTAFVNNIDARNVNGSTIVGGAGVAQTQMTITSGTGTSGRLVVRTPTSAGTATEAFHINESQQTVFANSGSSLLPNITFAGDTTTGIFRGAAGRITFTTAVGGTAMNIEKDTIFALDVVRLVTVAATAAGDVPLCISTTDVVRKGATCGSSSAKVKHGITPITNATAKLMALRPVAYSYRPGFYDGRSEFGLIAEEAAAVDKRLAFYAPAEEKLPGGVMKKGDPMNVNDRAVLALLIAEVQTLRRQVDSLRAIKK